MDYPGNRVVSDGPGWRTLGSSIGTQLVVTTIVSIVFVAVFAFIQALY